MELRHLRYALAVAEHRHFGRAARALGIQQPPLSQQIKALETELGVRLFDRTGRGVELTSAGEAFLPEAARAVEHAGRAASDARRAGRGEAGRLVLGFVGSATYSVLPGILRAFRARYPLVELVLRESPTAGQLTGLRDGALDLGLVRPPLPGGDADLVDVATVVREPFVAVLPPDHRLAGAATLALAELADEPFVLFPRTLGRGLHDQITLLCHHAGFQPTVVQEAVEMQTIVALVAGGLGVSLVPASVRRLGRDDVVFRPVEPSTRVAMLALAWRRDDTRPTTRNLIRLVRDAVDAAGRGSDDVSSANGAHWSVQRGP